MKTVARAGAKRNPVLGIVAAGRAIPLPAFDAQPLDSLDVARSTRVPPSGIFGLRVRGDSMMDARINDGDVVVIKPQNSAKNGDLIVARLHHDPTDSETTIKRFSQSGTCVILRPENPAYKPICMKASEVEIIGIVLAIWRDRVGAKMKSARAE